MSKNILKSAGLVSSVLGIVVMLAGCGQVTSTTATSGGSGSGSTASTITLTGTLATGTITTSSLGALSIKTSLTPQATSGSSASMSVVAQSTTGKTYSATADSQGSFSLSVPKDESFYVAIMKNGRLDGALIATTESSTSAVMGVKPTAEASLGTITIDESKGVALSSKTALMKELKDSTLTARASNGVPVGAGNVGKGSGSKLTSGSADSTKLDEDQDGLPNIFDADNDGDGLLDEMDDATASGAEGAKGLSKIQKVTLFMNLKIDYENTATFDRKTSTVLTLHVSVKDPTSVQKVEVIDAPSYKDTATVGPSGFTHPDNDYPTQGTKWSAANYKLVRQTQGSDTIWTMFLVPNDNVTAGDTFRFRVTFKDGTTEEALKMINYAFTNIPKLRTVNGAAAPSPSVSGTRNSPEPVSGSSGAPDVLTIVLEWDRPLDENGNPITGLKYSFHKFYYDASGQDITGGKTQLSNGPSDNAAGTTEMKATLTVQPSDVSVSTVGKYQIDVTGQDEAGDNTAQKVYFKKK